MLSVDQDWQNDKHPGLHRWAPPPNTLTSSAFVVLILISLIASPIDASIIMQDNFNDGVLTGWTVDVSPSGASATEQRGALSIFAHANSFAHVERENTEDLLTVRVKVKIGDSNAGDLWGPGVILYWGPKDWTRVSVAGTGPGILVTNVVDGEYSGYLYSDLPPDQILDRFIPLAIELTSSHINTYYGRTGDLWTRIQYRTRASTFSGAPTKIILGKGYGTGKSPYQERDLDNDASALGRQTLTSIDDFVATRDEALLEGPFLRKFPFPYKAGLAIASDVDGMCREEFLTIHQFLNTKQNTSLNPNPKNAEGMGIGVGLPIASSFWMYSDNDGSTVTDGMCYFNYDGNTLVRGSDADLIRTYFHAGYIDCIHSFGHFGLTGGFTRELGVAALEEMQRAGILPCVWSNHGDGYEMDNLGHDWNQKNLGDMPGSIAYHSDLSVFPDGPIRFLWNYKSDGLVDFPVANPVTVESLNDGKPVMTFQRFYGPGWTPEDLGNQLSRAMLDSLTASEGYMIVANHLAARGWPVPVFLDVDARAGLRRLESMYESGEIYVATTSGLLWNDILHFYTKWSWEGDPNVEVFINIEGIADPIAGDFIPTLGQLQGLTLCIPFEGNVNVRLDGEDVTGHLVFNDVDYLGVRSVSFPVKPLPPFPEWISDGYTHKNEDYDVPEYDYMIDVTNMGVRPHAPTLSYVGLHSFEIQEVRLGDFCHIWIPDSATVRLPLLAPGETFGEVSVLNGPRRRDIPRLVEVSGDSVEIESAVFLLESNSISITTSGMGWAELRIEDSKWPFPGADNEFCEDGSHVVSMLLEDRELLRSLNMRVEASSGTIGLAIEEWSDGEGGYKRWRQEADGVGVISYEIGDLAPSKRHAVKANGSVLGTYMSNEQGWLEFGYDGREPSLVFEVTDLGNPNRAEFWLMSVFPNPFISSEGRSASCLFACPGSKRAKLGVFDAKGRLVAKLVDKDMDPGIHKVEWTGLDDEGRTVPSGLYFYRLEVGRDVAQRKLMVVR